MRILSPIGVAAGARALAGRPWRHRRHAELDRDYPSPPPDAWWGGDDRWFPADTPPRHGNRLTPLVDGDEAWRAMYEAMEGATESIYLASWFITPQWRMVRPPDDPFEPKDGKGGPQAFLPLITRKAREGVDVRILLWPGAFAGKFARRHVKAVHRSLVRADPGIKARLDTHERLSHCQHQKTLVVDGRVAFAGGLDATAFDADRWDLPAHAFRDGRNWHDVDWRIEGSCVADVALNFVQRWNATAPGDALPTPAPIAPLEGGVDVQAQRTIPKGVYAFAPRGVFGIAYAYRRAIARAERFIYIENQYLWSPEITDALCDAIRRGHETGLRVVMVLPAHPNVGKGDTDRHIEDLLAADAGRGVFRPYALYTSTWDEKRKRYQYRPIYVHAKVAVVDDAWATVGSANLNGRGMATDSELNMSTTHRESIVDLRLRLWAEHLSVSADRLRDADPVSVLDGRWRTATTEQHGIVARRAGPLTAAVYPYPTGRVDADFGPGEVESALLDR